jgi:hypothetical protein
MKARITSPLAGLYRLMFAALTAGLFAGSTARAGLTIDIHLYHDSIGYYFYPWLNTNATPPNYPAGYYQIASPQIPSSGSQLQYLADSNGFNFVSGGGNYYFDVGSLMQQITNGYWSIYVTNSTSTNQYKFTVSAPNISSNVFAPVIMIYPTNGDLSVPNQPTFTWLGPTNWAGTLNIEDYFTDTNGNQPIEASADLPPGQTNWPCPVVLPYGTNNVNPDYQSNATAFIIAATPTNASALPISGWISTASLETYYNAQFIVTSNANSGPLAPGLVAHYAFDNPNNLGLDSSGNGYDMDFTNNFGSGGLGPTNDAIAGGGAVVFVGGDASDGAVMGWNSTPTNLLNTLAGTFSISVWVKTTDNFGYQGDWAFNGAGIVSADVPGTADDLVPIALTGGQVAFNTGNTTYGYDDTINSSTLVNDGNWHHVVVCRNQATGEKDIYIDGVLDTSDTDTTNLLNAPQMVTIGAIGDASQSDPNNGNYYNGYDGALDDLQIYSRFLNSNDVAYLFNNVHFPVDVSLQFTIIRSQDPNLGEIYGGGVSFTSVSPAPDTTNRVQSPNNYFNCEVYPGGGTGSGAILSSLNQVINEFTNGSWTIYINQGSPQQQVYTFQAAITGLDTNLLQPVKIFMPTNNAILLASPAYDWAGPTNFSTVQVELLVGPIAMLPVTATNWPSGPVLGTGSTNRFDVVYNSNDFGGVTFTTPVDASSNPVRSWAATTTLATEAFDNFIVAPLVVITNQGRVNGNVQFSFQTVATHTNIILSRTNLVVGTWVPVTNFVGDGTVKQFSFPTTNPPVRFFRVETQ